MAVEPFLGTRPQRGFIGTKAIAVLVLVAVVFGKVQAVIDTKMGNYKTLPCYFSLFALAEYGYTFPISKYETNVAHRIFILVITLDALRYRNIIQLLGILVFEGAMVLFSALQIHETRQAIVRQPGSSDFKTGDGPNTLWRSIEPPLITVSALIGVAWLSLIYWTRSLYFEFGWAIFHTVGANPVLKRMYEYYQIWICLLKFDFFAFVGLTIQLLILVIQPSSPEFAITIAAIPVVLILLVSCGVAVRREIKWLMTISLILMAAALSYFIFKFVRYYSPQTEGQYESTRNTLTFFTVVAFLLVFSSFGVGLRCFSDFDKGLRDAKTRNGQPRARRKSALDGSYGPEGEVHRMTID
ncbi:hypothetical protein Clacol_006679 [Clathrus columnatus]|uniref:Uncharacterized protein n=1 Tax=Clathrus columnatus TaxID=1419009 RepID=A0AAV5ACR1_9AGAM|nr:hypothetical protein Clacol_006679 [Clathrus columnatus]